MKSPKNESPNIYRNQLSTLSIESSFISHSIPLPSGNAKEITSSP